MKKYLFGFKLLVVTTIPTYSFLILYFEGAFLRYLIFANNKKKIVADSTAKTSKKTTIKYNIPPEVE